MFNQSTTKIVPWTRSNNFLERTSFAGKQNLYTYAQLLYRSFRELIFYLRQLSLTTTIDSSIDSLSLLSLCSFRFTRFVFLVTYARSILASLSCYCRCFPAVSLAGIRVRSSESRRGSFVR